MLDPETLERFAAEVVAFTNLPRLRRKEREAKYRPLIGRIAPAIGAIEAIEKQHLRLTLRRILKMRGERRRNAVRKFFNSQVQLWGGQPWDFGTPRMGDEGGIVQDGVQFKSGEPKFVPKELEKVVRKGAGDGFMTMATKAAATLAELEHRDCHIVIRNDCRFPGCDKFWIPKSYKGKRGRPGLDCDRKHHNAVNNAKRPRKKSRTVLKRRHQ